MTPQGDAARTGRPGRPKRRRWLRRLLMLPVLFVVLSAAQVAALRFVDPLFSSFMAIRQFEAWTAGEWSFRVAYDWRDLGDIAPTLPVALVAAEDQAFAGHRGFDLEAIEHARKRNERGDALRGGSTISQQLAKNLFLWQGRSAGSRWVRKGLETWYTGLIELMWPKRRILEVYANVVEFGDGVYGAQAAARTYFRRDAKDLTLAQSARMAAVLPSPKRYSIANPGPYVQRQSRWVERNVRQLGGAAYLDTLD
ncbi:monofunctional biosynthetic peptidoglycan transglycosylase [Luteimonas aestuarii]|uniref:Biosynthetic peptidoglycan transglycosylase n=1 Tax=Luteimonas aestuarii TaxID=453837 RepID=A0A4R5TTV3_9GAMM|nr:monofunctional biosynthetic peptidoglycan transglycosylase [Luteimonas aestuarii]TDK24449.1 monofunctional biosynthetic peptidoglycan transglycosylase [Luteimonas aestuarii]